MFQHLTPAARHHRSAAGFISRTQLAVFLLGALLIAGAVVYYVNTPDFVAGRQLASAQSLEQSGAEHQALEIYAEVADGPSSRTAEAVAAIARISRKLLTAGDGAAVLRALAFAAARKQRTGRYPFEGLLEVAVQRSRDLLASDPQRALVIARRLPRMAPQRVDEFEALRESLLFAAVKAFAQDASYAVELAPLLERQQRIEEAVAVLKAHESRLGTTEAARILGQFYMAGGELTRAYDLLAPYVSLRLKDMRETEATFDKRYDELWDAELAKLNRNEGPKSFYDTWSAAPEDKQPEIVDDHIRAALADNGELEAYRARWRELSEMVPLALDVGTLTLYRAQGIAEPSARRKALEQAEATFLAVQGVAGDTARFRKDLGQVYYWLGKHEEGKQQFDALLEAEKRASITLLDVAEIYRELGLRDEAAVVSNEAYENAKDDAERQLASRKLAHLATTLADEIKWLERSPPEDESVQASLSEARARKALDDDLPEEAAGHLRKAMQIYAAQEVDSASTNNFALAAFSLYRITPDEDVLRQARAKIIEAVQLAPSNGIVLGNAVENLLEFGLATHQEALLRLAEIEWEPDYNLFDALWNSSAEHRRVVAGFTAVDGVDEAQTYLGKVLVLRPKDVALYGTAENLYRFRRDAAELARFEQQLLSAAQQRSEYAASAARYFAGREDAAYVDRFKSRYEYWAENVVAFMQGKSALQRVLIARNFVTLSARAARFGIPVNARLIVRTALEADAASPSQMSRKAVVAALLLQVYTDLRADMRTLLARCRRCLGPDMLVAILAAQESELADKVRAQPAARAAAARLARDHQQFPGMHEAEDWALLSRLEPGAAAAVAADIEASGVAATLSRIDKLRRPSHPSTAYRIALLAQMKGDARGATAALAALAPYKLQPPVAM